MSRSKVIKASVEVLAWSILTVIVMYLVVNWQSVNFLLVSRGAADRLSAETYSPIETLLILNEISSTCASGGSSGDLGTDNYTQVGDERLEGDYELYYHARIDREKFRAQLYAEDGGSLDVQSEVSGDLLDLAYCVSKGMFNMIALGSGEELDNRVLWIYSFIELGNMGVFVSWPDNQLPDYFDPWGRPWVFDEIKVDYAKRKTFGSTEVFQTYPYADAATHDEIVSVAIPQEVNNLRLTSAVDVRVGSKPHVYAVVLFLNLVVCIAISVFCWISQRTFPVAYMKAWYRGWLALSLLFGLYSVSYFTKPAGSFSAFIHEAAPVAISFLSMVNSVFFYLAARAFEDSWNIKAQRLIALKLFGGVCALFVLAIFVPGIIGEAFPFSFAEVVEATFSSFVLLRLSSAMSKVLLACTESAQSTVLRWARWFVPGIRLFFYVYACQQMLIPFWYYGPFFEDVFWITSVIMKVTLFAIFSIVVLIELYWEKAEVNEIFLSEIEDGIVAVDSDFCILNTNVNAASIMRLPPIELKGKSLKQVLFRSLFEAEEFYERLRRDGSVRDATVKAKVFKGIASEDFEEVERDVSASLLARRGYERVFALFFVSETKARS